MLRGAAQREDAGRVRGNAAADAPVHIQLREDAEPGSQLPGEETERLLLRDVPARKRPILRAGCARRSVSTCEGKRRTWSAHRPPCRGSCPTCR